MKLLLDTHVLLWTLMAPERIPTAILDAIASPENQSHVSVVCLWEIAIKIRNGRLEAPADLPLVIAELPHFRVLPVTAEHAWRVGQLEQTHRDPFDHLLIAQALVEGMTIITHDRVVGRYGAPVVLV